MDLYLLFRLPWEDMISYERDDIRKRMGFVVKSFGLSDIFIGRGDVALQFSGRKFRGLDQAELDKVSGARVTFPASTAMDSFFFNVEDQLSDTSHPEGCYTTKSDEVVYNAICYHCGAKSLLLHSSNECSKRCQG